MQVILQLKLFPTNYLQIIDIVSELSIQFCSQDQKIVRLKSRKRTTKQRFSGLYFTFDLVSGQWSKRLKLYKLSNKKIRNILTLLQMRVHMDLDQFTLRFYIQKEVSKKPLIGFINHMCMINPIPNGISYYQICRFTNQ